MKVLINFSDDGYKKSQKLNTWMARYFAGFDKIIEYSPQDIDLSFYNSNKEILTYQRGCGLWLWKPYFILKTLKELDEGDFLFYCDSGAFMFRSCKYLIASMGTTDIWVSDIPLIEKEWSKPSMIKYLDADTNDIINTNQIQASFIGIIKTANSIRFVEKWLEKCCNTHLIFPSKNGEEFPCIAHREDQSILSVLCKKVGILPHRDPTQYGRIPEKYKRENASFSVPKHLNDRYPVMIIHHRTKDCNKKTIIRQVFNAFLPKVIVYRLIR